MKRLDILMKNPILFLFLVIGINASGQSLTRKVLFLGNSYTYVNDLPQIITVLAASTGDVLEYDSNLIGGYSLEEHAGNAVSRNKILSKDWDYIVLQEQSQRPSFVNPIGFMQGFSSLKNFIKANKPCTQITSFMTWGHQNGDAQNCPANPNVCTYQGMQTLITERYMSISSLYESEITPVGVVWKYIRDNHPSINLYQADGSHPSLAGSYLAACCLYTSIFRKDPMLISNNYGLDSNTASIIRSVTKSLIYDQMLDWYIGKYVPASYFNYAVGNGFNEVVLNSSGSVFYDSLAWDFGDGTTSAAINPTHNYTTNGTYTIQLTTYKCFLGQNLESVFQRTVNFCSHTNTVFPDTLILCPDSTDTIWTQPADSYQWCDYYGNPIAGATNRSLVVLSGTYSVLTTVNGCTEMSPQVLVDSYVMLPGGVCNRPVVDIELPDNIVYPNPVKDRLYIHVQSSIQKIEVYDLSGRQIRMNPVSANAFVVSTLPNGMYILKIFLENRQRLSAKFIKQ